MSDDQVRVDMAKLCANQLQKIGVNASAESKPSLDWAGQDCCIIGWGSPFDADDHTYKVFSTDAGDNYTGYSNQKIDQLLKDARHTENQEKRKALYQEFQEEMTKAMPYTFIAYVDADYAIKKEHHRHHREDGAGPPWRRRVLEHRRLENRRIIWKIF